MTPALLARRVQLATNAWLVTQSRTALPVQICNLTEIFSDIDLGKQWEAPFPTQYITTPAHVPSAYTVPGVAPTVTPATTVSAGGTASTTASTITFTSGAIAPTNSTTATVTSNPRENSIVRNLLYNEAVFGQYKAMNIKAKTLKDQLRARKVAYPLNARNSNMCLTYHVQGICNSGCRNAADHYAHSSAEDEIFRTWCATHYKLDA